MISEAISSFSPKPLVLTTHSSDSNGVVSVISRLKTIPLRAGRRRPRGVTPNPVSYQWTLSPWISKQLEERGFQLRKYLSLVSSHTGYQSARTPERMPIPRAQHEILISKWPLALCENRVGMRTAGPNRSHFMGMVFNEQKCNIRTILSEPGHWFEMSSISRW